MDVVRTQRSCVLDTCLSGSANPQYLKIGGFGPNPWSRSLVCPAQHGVGVKTFTGESPVGRKIRDGMTELTPTGLPILRSRSRGYTSEGDSGHTVFTRDMCTRWTRLLESQKVEGSVHSLGSPCTRDPVRPATSLYVCGSRPTRLYDVKHSSSVF